MQSKKLLKNCKTLKNSKKLEQIEVQRKIYEFAKISKITTFNENQTLSDISDDSPIFVGYLCNFLTRSFKISSKPTKASAVMHGLWLNIVAQ